MKSLVAIPVYNEERYLAEVLRGAHRHIPDVLVVDDGSTDDIFGVLLQFPDTRVLRHPQNQGYGAALRSAFAYACRNGFEVVITMDSDGQHEPSLLPAFEQAIEDCDIVSGSRYLQSFAVDAPAPKDRQRINRIVTEKLNERLRLGITDAFCGFKAYRTEALCRLRLTENGYAMPLELWVQAACHRLRIREVAVPRVYHDPNRSFGELLDDADRRLAYYQTIMDKALAEARERVGCGLPDVAFVSAPDATPPK